MRDSGAALRSGLFQSVFRNSVWSTLAALASPVLQFLFGGLTLRYVGVDAMGFSLAVAAVLGIAARFSTLGIGEAALPAIASALAAGDERRGRRLIGAVLIVYLVASVGTAALMLTFASSFLRWSKTPVDGATAFGFIAISCLTHVLGQIQVAATTVLRAASRYDLVTMATTPLSFISGVVACMVVPFFPSLTTLALFGFAGASVGLLLAIAAASRAVPSFCRPLPGIGELHGLVRYGFWLMLTHLFAILTGGVDELVITGTCGAAVVPPWAIGKRFWATGHTFLAQHVEHLIPTLGSLRNTAADAVDRVAGIMHWYIMLLAAVIYTLMAWSGEAIVGIVAGVAIGELCQPAIFAFSMFGMGLALLIIPITSALAAGVSRPSFVVSVLSNSVQLLAVYGLATTFGSPAVYYAPLVAIPFLLLAMGTTPASIFDPGSAWSRVQPVLVPLAMGLLGVISSLAWPIGLAGWQQTALGGLLAVTVFVATIALEKVFSVNSSYHAQLAKVVLHTREVATRSIAILPIWFQRGRTVSQHEKVPP